MGYELCRRDVRNVVHPYTMLKYNRRKQVITLERYNSVGHSREASLEYRYLHLTHTSAFF